MDDPNDFDAELARLARATDAIHPSPGFGERVALAIAADSAPEWQRGVLRFGRGTIAAAAILAVAAAVFAMQADRSDDATLAMTYGIEEVGW